MATVIRVVNSIIAGLALALLLVMAVEFVSAIVHPLPPDFAGTMDEMCRHVARYPHWILALVVVAWGGTTYASTWVTRRIGNRRAGAFVGLILLSAVAFNVAMLPYPIWFKVANLMAMPTAIFVALRSPAHGEATGIGQV
jgi:hypothetical protein